MVKRNEEKLGFPPAAAISGVMMSLTRAWTTVLKARPMTTATARSIRFPRSRNFLKPPIAVTLAPSCAAGYIPRSQDGRHHSGLRALSWPQPGPQALATTVLSPHLHLTWSCLMMRYPDAPSARRPDRMDRLGR